MSRKVDRVPVNLDSRGVAELPFADVKAILRGADDLVMRGGRSLLSQILKGARRKRLLELGLDTSPVFGYYRKLDAEQILARIDWVILKGYLRIEYDHRLPLLVYTNAGWEIEKETYAEELSGMFQAAAAGESVQFDVSELKDKNREVIWLLLAKLQATGNPELKPLLEAWANVDYKKVKNRIQQVMKKLGESPA